MEAQPDLDTSQRQARGARVAGSMRWGSLLAGGALTLYALNRRSTAGIPAALAGLGLLYRGSGTRVGAPTVTERRPAVRAIELEKAVTVKRPVDEVYRFWRELSNLPRFMRHLRSVEQTGDNRYHWVAQGPFVSRPMEWDTEITEERPGELIRWRSLPESPLYAAGAVSFTPAPGERGTEVHVTLVYRPAGPAGTAAARLFSPVAAQMLKEEIRRFKEVMEAGEAPTTEGQPSARME